MYKYFLLSLLFLLPFVSKSCKESDVENLYLRTPKDELLFWPEASSQTIKVQSNGEFMAESMDPWCKVSVDLTRPDNLTIQVDKNENIGQERTTEVHLNLKNLHEKISIKQLSETPKISTVEKNIYLNDNQNLKFSLEITTNIPILIEAPVWIKNLNNNTSKIGTHTYYFEVEPIAQTNSKREGEIIINAKEQSQHENIIIPIEQSNESSNFKAASYNIYVGDWSAQRKNLVYEILRKHDFDILGTQEGTINHITDILNTFKSYNHIGVGRDGDKKGEFSSIFYKEDKFELLDNGDFWYSKTPDEPSYGWDAVNYRRICSWGKFRDKQTQNVFYFFNSHFDHQGSVAQLESAKLLLSKIKAIVGEQYPVFAVGDYNSLPESDAIQTLLADNVLIDSRQISESPPFGTTGTFQRFDVNLESTHRIDFILVSNHISVKEYGVINDRIDGKCPSDHDPVVIIAEF